MRPKIEFTQICKSFYGVNALSDVSFAVHAGRAVGLIGENGAGKSTLMNCLGGNLVPDSGEITINGQSYSPKNPRDASNHGVAFIHQELNLFGNLSIADNLFINRYPRRGPWPFINKKAMIRQTQDALDELHLDLSPHDVLEKLQPGERQMIEIAKALSAGADIIIFDEPTTSLTSRETERLFDIIESLKADGKTIIYISHILQDVKTLCDDVVVLRDGQVVDFGSIENFDINRMITSMCGRQFDQLFPNRSSGPRQEKLLELENVSQPGIIKNISLTLHDGEVLGVFGLMGSGRSEMARIVFGLDEMSSGQIRVAGHDIHRPAIAQSIRHKLAFVTENRRDEGLMMDATISDNMALVSLREMSNRGGMIKTKKMSIINESAASLKIKTSSMMSPVKNLSGGNQQKVVFGKWLLTHPKIFIMDEPTRGIDIGAKYEVYSIINQLAENGAGILFISSELEELMGMCDRILVMRNGQVSGEFNRSEFFDQAIIRAAFGEHVN